MNVKNLFFIPAVILIVSLSGIYVHAETADLSALQQAGNVEWRFSDENAEAGPQDALGYLVTREKYTDFRINVEFWIEDDTNSGIFVRCVGPELVDADNCYEANIWDNHPNQESRTGSIVKHVTAAVHVDTIGKWNRYEVVVQGDTVSVTLNGEKTAVLTDDRLESGYIALQYGGKGRLRFRDLEITPL